MPSTVLVGAQWGDEGKGKITDLIASDYDYVVRFQGGNNAGHTVIHGDKKLALHLMPSGVMYENAVPVIGNGVVVDPGVLVKEMAMLEAEGISCKNLKISNDAHLITKIWTAPTRRASATRRSAPPSAASAPATRTRWAARAFVCRTCWTRRSSA